MSHARIDNHEALLRLFSELAGRRFIGVVDGLDCVELVFDGGGGNLVSIFTGAKHRGWFAHGGVAQSLIDEGYGAPEHTAETDPAR